MPAPLQQRAEDVGRRCERIGRIISRQAEITERKHRRLRAVNVVVGAIAAIVALSQPVATALGSSATQAIGVIAAIVLIIDGILPSLIREESPMRLRDYAFYIHGYSGMLANALIEEGVTEVQRRARIIALLELAEMNLSDVCGKFGFLFEEGIAAKEPNKAPEPTP